MRRPGAAGVKVTGCMQISEPGKMTGTTQLNAPSAWKSRLGAPSVRTSTLFTAPPPDAVKVTVTVCGPKATPTGCGVAKTLCARALAPASSKAVRTRVQLRFRLAVNAVRKPHLPLRPAFSSGATRMAAADRAGVFLGFSGMRTGTVMRAIGGPRAAFDTPLLCPRAQVKGRADNKPPGANCGRPGNQTSGG